MKHKKPCEIKGYKNKAVAFINTKFVCEEHYYKLKHPPKPIPLYYLGRLRK
jgi:hypothetical protein